MTSVSLNPYKIHDFGPTLYRALTFKIKADNHELVEHEELIKQLRDSAQSNEKEERARAIQALRYARRRMEGFKASSRIAKSTTAKSLSIEEMAKVAGLHDWYLTAYSVFSDAVHGNINDLEQQFIRSEDDNEIQAIRSGAIVDHLEAIYLCACEILLKGLEVMDDTFQIDSKDFREHMMGCLVEAIEALDS